MSEMDSEGGGSVGSAREFWNQRHTDSEGEAHDNFLNHPWVQGYISLRAFGCLESHLAVMIAEVRARTTPGARILSIGCGLAEKEMAFAERIPDRSFTAIDIADQIVEVARDHRDQRGVANLEIEVGDFNALTLEQNSFDIVLGLGAIHHVENLEGFWAALREGLKPDGSVLAQEFIGASRFQWTDAQVEMGDAALRELVPDRYQTHHDRIVRPSVEKMISLDPSEAVRSAEILATCQAAGFELDGYAGAGCSLLQPVLMHQIANFEPTDWSDNQVLAALFQREDELIKSGVLGDDFAAFVARPRAH